MKKFSYKSSDSYFILAYVRHAETNVCLCRTYVRVPDMEIGRTTKDGLTAPISCLIPIFILKKYGF